METWNPHRVKLFWAKVNKNGPTPDLNFNNGWLKQEYRPCWLWIGAKDKKRYGNFTVARNKTGKAHRFSFLLKWGWIIDHYQVDHECNNPSCVNPYHLLLLSPYENNMKSNSASAINKRKTHCKFGHEFTEDNIIRWKDGHRRCRTCYEKRTGSQLCQL